MTLIKSCFQSYTVTNFRSNFHIVNYKILVDFSCIPTFFHHTVTFLASLAGSVIKTSPNIVLLIDLGLEAVSQQSDI